MRPLLVMSLLLLSVWGGANVVIALDVGEQAPDFLLPSTMGDKVSLQVRVKQLSNVCPQGNEAGQEGRHSIQALTSTARPENAMVAKRYYFLAGALGP